MLHSEKVCSFVVLLVSDQEAGLEVRSTCPPSSLLSYAAAPNKTQVKNAAWEACFRSSLSCLLYTSDAADEDSPV